MITTLALSRWQGRQVFMSVDELLADPHGSPEFAEQYWTAGLTKYFGWPRWRAIELVFGELP